MWKEIGSAFSQIGTLGDDCRAVLLMGTGKAFCGGIDISDPAFMMPSSDETDDVARRGMGFLPQILEMQRCFTAVETCPVPVVCYIHGFCIGGGIDLACCADIRLCDAATATFSVKEVQLGLAADVGTLQRFPKIVGHGSRVRELCLTGVTFDAAEAARIGFVSRTSPLDEAIQVCREIAKHSPVAVAGTKKSLNYSRDHTIAEGLEHVAMHNSLALLSDDLVASFTAAASRTQPEFVNMAPHSRL
jgi:delta(3,5)-delta(2,4)-dienoyl-CoA isomerase